MPRLQAAYSAPGPPSSQSPSKAQLHVFEQVCPTVPRSWRRMNSLAPGNVVHMVGLMPPCRRRGVWLARFFKSFRECLRSLFWSTPFPQELTEIAYEPPPSPPPRPPSPHLRHRRAHRGTASLAADLAATLQAVCPPSLPPPALAAAAVASSTLASSTLAASQASQADSL